MKHCRLFLLACLVSVAAVSSAQYLTLNGTKYKNDTIALYPVGPGTEFLQIRLSSTTSTSNNMDVFLLRADTKNEYVSIEQELGSGKVVGTERPSNMARRITTPTHIAFAGVNGDFFATTGDVGRPTGLTIENSEYAYIGSTNRHVGGVKANGRALVADTWKYTGRLYTANNKDTLVIKRVNYTRGENELVLYNQYQGLTTGTNEYGTELLVELATGETWKTNGRHKVVVRDKQIGQGNMSIPKGQAVLSGHGTMKAALDTINIGDTLTVRYTLKIDGTNTNLSQAVGGDNYVLIVDSGRIPESDYWNELHPRTGYGMSEKGDTALFCVVDGRSMRSVGCNTKVLGEIMKHYGAWRAVNWDGGGSSSMYIREIKDQVNNGSDGAERAVGNAMFIVANVPDEDQSIAQIQCYDQKLRLPLHGVRTVTFLGYNKYGILVDTDLQGVIIEPDSPETGYVNAAGDFVCLGSGMLKATYENISINIPVEVVNDAKMSLRLDSVLLSDETHYEVEVNAEVLLRQMPLQASAFDWTVEDPTIAEITEEGVITGVSNGRTQLFCQQGDFKDTLIVNVQIPETKPLLWNNFLDIGEPFTLKGSVSSWNTAVNTLDNGMAGLYINFNGGRQPNVKFVSSYPLYSVPRQMELRLTPNSFPLQKIIIGLRANNQKDQQNVTFENLKLTETNSLIIDLDSVFKGFDIASYPIYLEYITMYLNTSVEKKEYTMQLDGIYLHFDGVTSDIETIKTSSKTNRLILHEGLLYIRHDDELYTIVGQKISK